MSQLSTGLKNGLLGLAAGSNDLAHLLSGVVAGASAGSGSMHCRVFAGSVPTDIDAGVGAATQIFELKDSAHANAPLSFAIASGGAIAKNTGETWASGVLSGLVSGPFTATFAVLSEGADDVTTSSATAPRLLITIAQAGHGVADWLMVNPVFNNGDSYTANTFQVDAFA